MAKSRETLLLEAWRQGGVRLESIEVVVDAQNLRIAVAKRNFDIAITTLRHQGSSGPLRCQGDAIGIKSKSTISTTYFLPHLCLTETWRSTDNFSGTFRALLHVHALRLNTQLVL